MIRNLAIWHQHPQFRMTSQLFVINRILMAIVWTHDSKDG